MATILCVDDDSTTLEFCRVLLESRGHEVLTAPDGPTGIARTRIHRIDAIVADFNMPSMDWNEIAAVLRKEQPALPFVIWSRCPEKIPESLRWFANVLLYKSDGAETLLSAIDRVLNDSGNRSNLAEQVIPKTPTPTPSGLAA